MPGRRDLRRGGSRPDHRPLKKRHDGIVARCLKAEKSGGITASLIAEAQEIDWDLHATIIDGLGNAIISDCLSGQLPSRSVSSSSSRHA